MDKKTVLSIVVIIAGIAGLVWWGKAAEKKEVSSSELSHPARTPGGLVLSQMFYDFGTISMKNGDVSKIISVTNPGESDIRVSSVSTSCMCTKAYIVSSDGKRKGPYGMAGHGGALVKANEVIKAGESVDIDVVYDPNAHGPAGVGRIARSVFIRDETGNVVEFKFRVNVTP